MEQFDARRVKRITGCWPLVWVVSNKRLVRTRRPVVALWIAGRDCDGYDFGSVTYALPEWAEDERSRIIATADGPVCVSVIPNVRELRMAVNTHESGFRHGWDDDRFDPVEPEDRW